MSLKDCLSQAVKGKEITQEDADRLARDFERLRKAYAQQGETTADARAQTALAAQLAAEAKHKRYQAKLSAISARRINSDLYAWRDAKGRANVAAAALEMLERQSDTTRFESVEGRRHAILGMAHAKMEDVLYNFRRSALLGDARRHNPAMLDNLVKEAFGEHTGDVAAKQLAKAWTDTTEWLRQRFNAAGGAIGKLERWGLPQHHDAKALLKAGLPEWKKQILPRLDLNRMRHPLTSQPIAPGEIDDILDGIWADIVTDGWQSREPKRQTFGRGSLANQRAEHRFLIFNSADDWLSYQRDFGGGSDPFAAMMGHVSGLSRDIAAMEILGPNPVATIEWMKQTIEREGQRAAAGLGKAISKDNPQGYAGRMQSRLDAVWGSIRGSLNTPADSRFAAIGAGARAWITASVLGSATLSATSDIGTSAITRAFAGIKASGTFADIVSAMLPTQRREAVAAGLILDNAVHVFHTQARYVGTLGGPKWVEYLGDRVLTLSGLTPWTQSARHAFGLAFMREASEQAKRSFSSLDPAFASRLSQYGITPSDWDRIRGVQAHDLGRGVNILRPQEIAATDPRLAERYLSMILNETEYAVPSGRHRSRTIMLDQNQPGTLPGELVRSMAQFKSFGAVYAMLHGARMMQLLATPENRRTGIAYGSALVASSLIFGGLSIQLKQIAAGRDPRRMDDPAFWGAAALQGGGLGIYGDFFFSDLNRYGGGLASTLAGPVAERGTSFLNLTIGNAVELGTGQDTHAAREAVRFLRGNVPFGNIWYTRLVWERGLLDNLQYLADPDASASFKRRQRYWLNNYGQSYWWAPGTQKPQRAPDPMAAMGQ